MKPIHLDFHEIAARLGPGPALWDPVRKKKVKADPEERVRQMLIHYFIEQLGVPRGLISVEKQIKVGPLLKRYDILVHDRSGKALLLVECKAPDIKISQKVLDQAGRYNLALKVPWLLVSNGHVSYCAHIDHLQGRASFVSKIPDFHSLSTS